MLVKLLLGSLSQQWKKLIGSWMEIKKWWLLWLEKICWSKDIRLLVHIVVSRFVYGLSHSFKVNIAKDAFALEVVYVIKKWVDQLDYVLVYIQG